MFSGGEIFKNPAPGGTQTLPEVDAQLSGTDLKTLYTALAAADAGVDGVLLNKSDPTSRIVRLMSLGSGVVRPIVDWMDGYTIDEAEDLDYAPRPVVHLDRVTPHQCGVVAAASTGTAHTLDAGHSITATSGNMLVWDVSAGTVLAGAASVTFTRSGDVITFGSSLSIGTHDLVFVLGVSEFEIGSDNAWRPGYWAGSGSPTQSRIDADGWLLQNAVCSRIRYLFSTIAKVYRPPSIEGRIHALTCPTASDWAVLGYASAAKFLGAGTVSAARCYTRGGNLDGSGSSGAAGTAPASGEAERMRAILVPYDPLGTVTLGCFGVLADDDGVMDATAYYSGATLAMASSIDEVAASVDGNTAAVILRLSKLYMEI